MMLTVREQIQQLPMNCAVVHIKPETRSALTGLLCQSFISDAILRAATGLKLPITRHLIAYALHVAEGI